jgi:hypothetical protein
MWVLETSENAGSNGMLGRTIEVEVHFVTLQILGDLAPACK